MWYFSAFVFFSSGYLLLPTLPLILQDRGASTVEVGVVMGAFTLVAVLVRIPVGTMLAHGLPSRLLRGGQAMGAMGYLAFLAYPGIWPLLAGRILQGMGLGAFTTAAYVHLDDHGGPQRRGEFISLFGLTANMAMAIAPAAGALLLLHAGHQGLFAAGLALGVLGLLTVPRSPSTSTAAPRSTGELAWDLRAWQPASSMLGLALAYGLTMVFVPIAMVEAGAGQSWYFYSVYAAVIMGTRITTRRRLDRGRRQTWIIWGTAAIAVALLLLSSAGGPIMFTWAALFFGLGVGIGHPSLMAYALEAARPSARGGATAMSTAAFDGGIAAGAILGGWVTQQWSLSAAFLLVAVLMGVLLLPILRMPRPTPPSNS